MAPDVVLFVGTLSGLVAAILLGLLLFLSHLRVRDLEHKVSLHAEMLRKLRDKQVRQEFVIRENGEELRSVGRRFDVLRTRLHGPLGGAEHRGGDPHQGQGGGLAHLHRPLAHWAGAAKLPVP